MTLNSTGPISIGGTTTGQSIEIELGQSGTVQASLNDSALRTLAGVASGAISLSNFYGKSNRASLSYTFTTSTPNASLNVTSIGGYISGKSDITVTVNSGVYLYATSTSNYGLTLTGGNTGDTITLVNNGYIMGQGGNGGGNAPASPIGASAGGPALSLGYNTTINNTNSGAYIGGGGGGGGYGGAVLYGDGGGGGGAGGGVGGNAGCSGAPGGSGGGLGGSGGNGYYNGAGGGPGLGGGAGGGGGTSVFYCGGPCGTSTVDINGGGGGGRIFPGSGGGGGATVGGAGGSANAAGGPGGHSFVGACSWCGAGGGGGWGASGGAGRCSAGAGGGKAVALNGHTVTWVSGCTARVYGAVS
jgi:hypothetical protein